MATLVVVRGGHSVGRHNVRDVPASGARCCNLAATTVLVLSTRDFFNVHVVH